MAARPQFNPIPHHPSPYLPAACNHSTHHLLLTALIIIIFITSTAANQMPNHGSFTISSKLSWQLHTARTTVSFTNSHHRKNQPHRTKLLPVIRAQAARTLRPVHRRTTMVPCLCRAAPTPLNP
jgi:hypothetical protein